jgi:sugar lactone lactonase YvrE
VGTSVLGGSHVDNGLAGPASLAFDPDGSLLLVDSGHKQVKRIPAGKL